MSFGLRANLGNILQLFNYRADLFVLNAVVSQGEVGRYAVATSVTALGQLMPRALASVVMPRVAALDATEERGALDMVLVKSVRHAVLIALVMSVVLALALLLVPAVYGPEFEGAVVLGLLLIPGVGFVAVGGVLSSTIVGKGKPQYSLYNVLMVTPLTLALYASLIPALGAVGAALASSVSYIATTVVAWYLLPQGDGPEHGRAQARARRDPRLPPARRRIRAPAAASLDTPRHGRSAPTGNGGSPRATRSSGVGWLGLGEPFNRWMYRVRRWAFLRRIGPLLRGRPPEVLDVGTGSGFYVERWAGARARARSRGPTSPTPRSDRLRQRFPGHEVRPARHRPRTARSPGGAFDAISAMDMLFHITDDAPTSGRSPTWPRC